MNNVSISISLVDFIGKIDDGVCVILSLELNGEFYEMMYWFNKDKYTLVVEDKFYNDFPKIKDIMEYELINDIIEYINIKVLPPREEIFINYKM